MMRATSIARTLSTRASALATTTTTSSQTILPSRHVLYRSFASDRIDLIVNAVGVDRPGIVSDISQHVTDAGGNVGESQASRLGDYFSLMMVVSAPQSAEDLRVTLQQLPGLDVSVFDAPNPAGKATAVSPVVGCKYECDWRERKDEVYSVGTSEPSVGLIHAIVHSFILSFIHSNYQKI